MDIGGVGSAYADYMAKQAASGRTQELQKKIESGGASADDAELKAACKEFEAYFVEQVFNAMLETTKVFSDKEEDGYASKMVDYFKDFAVQELCDKVTEGNGLGLANTLYEQMKRNYGIGTAKLEEVSQE